MVDPTVLVAFALVGSSAMISGALLATVVFGRLLASELRATVETAVGSVKELLTSDAEPEAGQQIEEIEEEDGDDDTAAPAPVPASAAPAPAAGDDVSVAVVVPSVGPAVYTQRARRRTDRTARRALSDRLHGAHQVLAFRMFPTPSGVRLHVCYASGAHRDFYGDDPHVVLAAACAHTFGVDS